MRDVSLAMVKDLAQLAPVPSLVKKEPESANESLPKPVELVAGDL